MAQSRFDQVPNAAYGRCLACDIELATEGLADDHMHTTFEEARAKGKSAGHSVSVLNPSRSARIQRYVDDSVRDAISQAISELVDTVEAGDITDAEMTAAISRWSDFTDEWEETLAELKS
jgi:hypothetical protein